MSARVVQWIERTSPEGKVRVRFSPCAFFYWNFHSLTTRSFASCNCRLRHFLFMEAFMSWPQEALLLVIAACGNFLFMELQFFLRLRYTYIHGPRAHHSTLPHCHLPVPPFCSILPWLCCLPVSLLPHVYCLELYIHHS